MALFLFTILSFPGESGFHLERLRGNPSISRLSNLDAMLASHKISADKKTNNDFRIIILGDSSIWGFLQKPENTLAGLLEKRYWVWMCRKKC